MGVGIPVYIIDDDEGILESTGFLLECLDVQSKGFSDPFTFLKQLRSLERGCVLTDLRMPTMNGLELYDALRTRGIDWPVILMSAHANRELGDEILGRSFVALLEKPFTGMELKDALGRAFALLQNSNLSAASAGD